MRDIEVTDRVTVELFTDNGDLELMYCDFCDLGYAPTYPIIEIRQCAIRPTGADENWEHNTKTMCICSQCTQNLVPLLQHMLMKVLLTS